MAFDKAPSALLVENFDPHVPTRTLRPKFSIRLASGTFSKPIIGLWVKALRLVSCLIQPLTRWSIERRFLLRGFFHQERPFFFLSFTPDLLALVSIVIVRNIVLRLVEVGRSKKAHEIFKFWLKVRSVWSRIWPHPAPRAHQWGRCQRSFCFQPWDRADYLLLLVFWVCFHRRLGLRPHRRS